MLSNVEKIIFVLLTLGSAGASYVTFGKMFKVIQTGTTPIIWKDVLKNWKTGLTVFFSQNTLFKTRRFIGFLHALVAWGFTLYLIVNIVDVLYGFLSLIHISEPTRPY